MFVSEINILLLLLGSEDERVNQLKDWAERLCGLKGTDGRFIPLMIFESYFLVRVGPEVRCKCRHMVLWLRVYTRVIHRCAGENA